MALYGCDSVSELVRARSKARECAEDVRRACELHHGKYHRQFVGYTRYWLRHAARIEARIRDARESAA